MSTINLNGMPIHTVGTLPPIGTQAPDFTVTKTDLSDISLKELRGKKIVLNIFVSLDTDTCAAAMHQFNIIANQLKDSLILCISADLPFAQKRFCSANNLNNVIAASTFRYPKFGDDYGVRIIDSPIAGLLARAVITIDEHGKIIYTEEIREIMTEPDYAAIPVR